MGPSSSNHTPSSHSNQSGSSSRHGSPSPTIFAPPSTASPAPSGESHQAMGAPARAPQRRNGAPPQPPKQPPSISSLSSTSGRIRRHASYSAYDAKAFVRYGTLMHEIHTLGVRPDLVTNEAWNRYRDYWASADFRARSEKASHNRKNEKGGPGTSPSKHTGGTRSFRTYEDILALDKDEDYEVTPNDVFLHVHTKYHDGVTYINSRSAQFHFEAFVQSHLGMRMDFGANTSHAPPPPPPQEHHQQIGMDPACSPQQQHDDDDRDHPDWVDEEHLGDERCYSTTKESFEGDAGRWRRPTAGFVA
ncbi:hypothetical protein Scep_009988 [Stephania cephalantha]|uniref:Uncharacterized protein n=1 Tax=Stephania cephalantha TaxID=152367 RepID=A0AAP0JU90_9MAGN